MIKIHTWSAPADYDAFAQAASGEALASYENFSECFCLFPFWSVQRNPNSDKLDPWPKIEGPNNNRDTMK